MLEVDPAHRCTAMEIKDHPWVNVCLTSLRSLGFAKCCFIYFYPFFHALGRQRGFCSYKCHSNDEGVQCRTEKGLRQLKCTILQQNISLYPDLLLFKLLWRM